MSRMPPKIFCFTCSFIWCLRQNLTQKSVMKSWYFISQMSRVDFTVTYCAKLIFSQFFLPCHCSGTATWLVHVMYLCSHSYINIFNCMCKITFLSQCDIADWMSTRCSFNNKHLKKNLLKHTSIVNNLFFFYKLDKSSLLRMSGTFH